MSPSLPFAIMRHPSIGTLAPSLSLQVHFGDLWVAGGRKEHERQLGLVVSVDSPAPMTLVP